MDLFVNGAKIDVTLEDEKTIGDVLRSFEATCEENDAAVIGIRADGQKVDAFSFDEYAKLPLSSSTKIEFEVVTKQSIADSFKELSVLFSSLAERMERVPVDLQSGKGKEATAAIAELADDIEVFCRTASLASLFPDTYGAIVVDGKQVSDFFADLTPVLSEFEQALKANDTVLVGDLAEYEICPRLKLASKALEVFHAL